MENRPRVDKNRFAFKSQIIANKREKKTGEETRKLKV